MDNGPQFVSTEFQHFLELNAVHPIMCSVFNLRENGLVERWNCTLKGGVQAFCSLGYLGVPCKETQLIKQSSAKAKNSSLIPVYSNLPKVRLEKPFSHCFFEWTLLLL